MNLRDLLKSNNYRYFILSFKRVKRIGLIEFVKEGVHYYKRFLILSRKVSKKNRLPIAFKLYLVYNFCKAAYVHSEEESEFILSYVPSKLQNFYFEKINPVDKKIITFDKIRFYRMLDCFKLPYPEIVFYNQDGFNYLWDGNKTEPEKILNQYQDILFVKPIRDNGGVGTERLKEFNKIIIKENCVYQKNIVNHPELVKIGGDKALNTVRIITYINKDNRFDILSAILRLSKDKIVDNWGQGSINVKVDPHSGKLGKIGLTKYNEQYTRHPQGLVDFEDYQLPMWDEFLRILQYAAEAFRVLKFIAWDIGISPDGPTIVEANAGCDLFHAQLFEPYLHKSIITDFIDLNILNNGTMV